MTSQERDAIIKYLEYRLRVFMETFEREVDPVVVYQMYDLMFDILADLEDNIVTNQLIEMSEKGLLKDVKKNLPKKDE